VQRTFSICKSGPWNRNARHLQTCHLGNTSIAESAISRASKAASQQRWLAKAGSRDYFQGPENVAAAPRPPATVPVLAVVGAKDDYFSGSSCKVTRRINGSKSILIPDADHDIMGHPRTKSAIKDFLRGCCQ